MKLHIQPDNWTDGGQDMQVALQSTDSRPRKSPIRALLDQYMQNVAGLGGRAGTNARCNGGHFWSLELEQTEGKVVGL